MLFVIGGDGTHRGVRTPRRGTKEMMQPCLDLPTHLISLVAPCTPRGDPATPRNQRDDATLSNLPCCALPASVYARRTKEVSQPCLNSPTCPSLWLRPICLAVCSRGTKEMTQPCLNLPTCPSLRLRPRCILVRWPPSRCLTAAPPRD